MPACSLPFEAALAAGRSLLILRDCAQAGWPSYVGATWHRLLETHIAALFRMMFQSGANRDSVTKGNEDSPVHGGKPSRRAPLL